MCGARGKELTVSVTLGLLLVDVVVEAEEVDTLGEGGAALDGASLDGGLDVGELLATVGLHLADGLARGGTDVHSADGHGHCC